MKATTAMVLYFIICLGLLLYAQFERDKKEDFDLSEQNILVVQCVDKYGNLETYHINIPSEVKNIEYFAKGFCDSLEE